LLRYVCCKNIPVNNNFVEPTRSPECESGRAGVAGDDAGLTTEYFPPDIYVNPVRS
jgi:hypothetical protein